jgi:hypothetical protein
MSDRKTIAEMGGEFLREAAVLIAVFIPLDLTMLREPLTVGWWMAILGISGGTFVAGVALERTRKS